MDGTVRADGDAGSDQLALQGNCPAMTFNPLKPAGTDVDDLWLRGERGVHYHELDVLPGLELLI